MSNLEKAKSAIGVVINGKEEKLIFDFWALSLIEEEKGANFFQSCNKITLPKIIFLAWAGLVATHPELDGVTSESRRVAQKLVASWCENTDLALLTRAIVDAFGASQPEAKNKKNEEAEAMTTT